MKKKIINNLNKLIKKIGIKKLTKKKILQQSLQVQIKLNIKVNFNNIGANIINCLF